MRALAQALLRGPSPLTPAEREMIATYVSSRNGCRFCTRSHAATARKLGAPALEDASAKMKALFAIADHVRANVAPIPSALVESAKREGADDVTLHDAALIAAAFSMFNRYVDGLGADTPDEGDSSYEMGAERLTKQGYVPPV
jgi:AhpD family alkylhydroperoxidase